MVTPHIFTHTRAAACSGDTAPDGNVSSQHQDIDARWIERIDEGAPIIAVKFEVNV